MASEEAADPVLCVTRTVHFRSTTFLTRAVEEESEVVRR